MSEDYTIRVREKDGRFYCVVPELGLIGSGSDLPSAYAVAVEKKRAVLAEAAAAGIADMLSAPERPTAPTARPSLPLADLAVRTAVVTGVVAALLAGTGYFLVGSLEARILRATDLVAYRVSSLKSNFGGRRFWGSIERQIATAAQEKNEIDPERREKVLGDIRVLVERAKPFVRELQPLFACETPAEQKTSPQKW